MFYLSNLLSFKGCTLALKYELGIYVETQVVQVTGVAILTAPFTTLRLPSVCTTPSYGPHLSAVFLRHLEARL
jgi:hypothetical protein